MQNVILQPIEVGGQTFKNRIMFPPLTTGYEKNGMISEQDMGFYTRLAKGGVGYIVLGDVAPINSFSPTPKLFDDSQIPAFKALADSVHAYGTKLGVQLLHIIFQITFFLLQLLLDSLHIRQGILQAFLLLLRLFYLLFLLFDTVRGKRRIACCCFCGRWHVAEKYQHEYHRKNHHKSFFHTCLSSLNHTRKCFLTVVKLPRKPMPIPIPKDTGTSTWNTSCTVRKFRMDDSAWNLDIADVTTSL